MLINFFFFVKPANWPNSQLFWALSFSLSPPPDCAPPVIRFRLARPFLSTFDLFEVMITFYGQFNVRLLKDKDVRFEGETDLRGERESLD